MWATVYMAEGKELAKEIESKLQSEGFLVKVKPFVKKGEDVIYQILVPEFEAEEVQTVLFNLGY